ncbi:MAG: glutathione peroxidase [Bacteroidales bacterium]
MEFYDLAVNKPGGEPIRMSEYRGKPLLIVNTATRCGLAPQFRGLETLHQKYKDQGLVVLGFPSNQFRQEPEENETVEEVCALNFGVTFQLTGRIRVNGKETHPVFRYLKDELPGKLGKRITWNFTKFLITREGKPYKRYTPNTKPAELEEDIRTLLATG